MSKDVMVYVNDEYVKENEASVSVFDRGLLYGDGFFEGIRVYNGKIFLIDEHIDRFFESAKYVFMPLKYTKDQLKEIMYKLVEINGVENGYIRLVMTRGVYNLGIIPPKDDVAKPNLICIASNITLYKKEFYDTGINVVFSSFIRMNPATLDPQCKSINYMSNILAKLEASQRDAQEAIFLNTNGVVTECTGDNIFIIKDNKVYTPPVHVGILNGITRILVINIMKKLGYEVYEKEFTRFNVYTADECFLTGTAAEVIGVVKIDNRTIGDGKIGNNTKTIMNEFKKYIANECK